MLGVRRGLLPRLQLRLLLLHHQQLLVLQGLPHLRVLQGVGGHLLRGLGAFEAA